MPKSLEHTQVLYSRYLKITAHLLVQYVVDGRKIKLAFKIVLVTQMNINMFITVCFSCFKGLPHSLLWEAGFSLPTFCPDPRTAAFYVKPVFAECISNSNPQKQSLLTDWQRFSCRLTLKLPSTSRCSRETCMSSYTSPPAHPRLLNTISFCTHLTVSCLFKEKACSPHAFHAT